MCTLTWRTRAEGGYELFFNRDERLTRATETGPSVRTSGGGMRFVAPADGGRGGTWLALNEAGLTVCVLNDYPRGVVETGRGSRGELPLACMDCADAPAVARVLRDLRLGEYAPFHLVAIDARGGAVHGRWDGRVLHEAEAPAFLTSSSFDPVGVRARRTERFAGRGEAEADETFHWAHDVADGAGSILMRRDDACTRSVCTVRVGQGGKVLIYRPVVWPEGVAGTEARVEL